MLIETRFNQDAFNNAIREFLDIADDDAADWLSYLLEGYLAGPAIMHTDASVRIEFMRNLNAISGLVRTLQRVHEENYRSHN